MSKILTSLKPLIIFSELTGYIIFCIDQKRWRAEIKFWNFLIGIKTLILNVIIHIFYWNSVLDFSVQGTEVVKQSIPKLLYCNLIAYFFAQFWFFFKRHEMVKMVKIISEIDEKFLELNVKFHYKNQQRKILKALLGSLICNCLIVFYGAITINFYNLPIDAKYPLIQFYGFMCLIVILHHFSLGTIAITQRFRKLNNFMDYNPHLIDFHHMRKFTKLHFEICNLIRAYNNVYGSAMVSMMAIAFLWFCLFIFTVATATKEFMKDYFLIVILQIITNAVLFGILFIMIRLAENAKNEGKLTKIILYDILHKINDYKQRELIESFIYRIDHTSMEISVGIFDFNWSFMFKV